MRVASCQLPDVWNDLPRTLSLVRRYAVAAEHQGINLLCFPECYLSGHKVDYVAVERNSMDVAGPRFQQALEIFNNLKLAVIVGFVERSGGEYYNSAAVISQGRLYGVHRKVHLQGTESNVFKPGLNCGVYQLNGLQFGVNISDDLNEPALASTLQAQGAQALICPVNSMLPRQFALKWKQLHTTVRSQRAKSTKLWMISSDVTGIRDDSISYGSSSIINPDGRVLKRIPSFSTGLIDASIHTG